jgi:hypothetical protein
MRALLLSLVGLVAGIVIVAPIAEAASGYGRTISFSGESWRIKIASSKVGPGPNFFSDSTENVWVDGSGRLHLRITKQGGRWLCAEVVSNRSFGYGTYRWYLDSAVDALDPSVVLGLFTWNDDSAFNHRELDIEFSRWGDARSQNAQYVVQPWDTPGNLYRFNEPAGLNQSTHSFTWLPTSARFQSVRGLAAAPSSANPLIVERTFTSGIPQAGGENARINLWLYQGRAPTSRKAVEVIVNRFEFVPTP